jgi:hypothetical protein
MGLTYIFTCAEYACNTCASLSKVKLALYQDNRPRGGVLYSFFNLGAQWEWVVNTLHPAKSSGTNCIRGWGFLGRCGRVRKISPPSGFDPLTVQPVASRYPGPRTPHHVSYYMWALYINIQLENNSKSTFSYYQVFLLTNLLGTEQPAWLLISCTATK